MVLMENEIMDNKQKESFAKGLKDLDNHALQKLLISIYSNQRTMCIKFDRVSATVSRISRKINRNEKNE